MQSQNFRNHENKRCKWVEIMHVNCLTKLQLINTHKCVFTTRVLRELNAHFGQLGITSQQARAHPPQPVL